MPRKLRSPFEYSTGRLKLAPQKKPHWQRLGPGLSLGYRRNQGPGTWSMRASDHAGGEWLKRFGIADDYEPADGKRVLSYDQAVAMARKLLQGDGDNDEGATKPVTVDEALTAYKADLLARSADPYNARQPRRHLTPSLLSKPVALITDNELKAWRDGLIGKRLAPTSINRMCNSLHAALKLVAPHRSHILKAGLEKLPNNRKARNVVLSDAEVLALVGAAYEYEPALGLFCDVLATTGTRPSQAVRLLVQDLHTGTKPKLMMPASGKGGGRKRAEKKIERFAVPITPHLALRLLAAAKGRAGDARLLLRSNGQPWSEKLVYDNYGRDIRVVVKSLGHDPKRVTAYALRHSSITRQLLRGVPTRVVAATHNTSVAQIEKHYSAQITEHSDDLTRSTLLHLDNVVSLAS